MIPFLSYSPSRTGEEACCCPIFQFVIPAKFDTHYNNRDVSLLNIILPEMLDGIYECTVVG